MRIWLLTPGTGHFHCGSCLRDEALGRALRRLGHEVLSVPLYLPLVLERDDHDSLPGPPPRMGGINLYLQQKSAWARRLPRPLRRALDAPGLLRRVARMGSLTQAPDLGAMTVSMLRGEDGRQAEELHRLVAWARDQPLPDVVVLSNAMLCGIAGRLGAALQRPVVATLQGEAPFLDALPAPWKEQAWRVLAERARGVRAFVAVSRWYGELMRDRLGLPADAVHVIHNGIETDDFATDPLPLADRSPPAIGYLARMCRDKGLHTLVEAFVHIQQQAPIEGLRLRICGVELREDRALVRGLRRRLRERGLERCVDFLSNVDRAQKLAFLGSVSVLSVPATYGESFGLYVLEALASGVPVVQPRHGAFPEILAATGGGELCAPDDPVALATALRGLLTDPVRAQALADAGRQAVTTRFTAARMAGEVAELCAELS